MTEEEEIIVEFKGIKEIKLLVAEKEICHMMWLYKILNSSLNLQPFKMFHLSLDILAQEMKMDLKNKIKITSKLRMDNLIRI
jgi:hypothetical protein